MDKRWKGKRFRADKLEGSIKSRREPSHAESALAAASIQTEMPGGMFTVWDFRARLALSFERNASEPGRALDRAILQAFQRHKLDPKDPLSWRTLIGQLVLAHYGIPAFRKAGGQIRNTSSDRTAAQKTYQELFAKTGRAPTKIEIARKLAKGSNVGVEAWRKRLRPINLKQLVMH